MTHFL